MLTRMWRNWISYLPGMLNGTAILENSWAVFFPVFTLLSITLQRNENLYSHENLYLTVHSNFIHNQNS